MRKSELDRLLLTAVARAIGQPIPETRRPRRQSPRAQARKHMPMHFNQARHEPQPLGHF